MPLELLIQVRIMERIVQRIVRAQLGSNSRHRSTQLFPRTTLLRFTSRPLSRPIPLSTERQRQ